MLKTLRLSSRITHEFLQTLGNPFLDHGALLSRFGEEAQAEKVNRARMEVLFSACTPGLGRTSPAALTSPRMHARCAAQQHEVRGVGCPVSPPPSVCACAGWVLRDQEARLSERSEFERLPRKTRPAQVARSVAEGRRQRGRLSFAYFSLAKQRKVSRPPGRDPACHWAPARDIPDCVSLHPGYPGSATVQTHADVTDMRLKQNSATTGKPQP